MLFKCLCAAEVEATYSLGGVQTWVPVVCVCSVSAELPVVSLSGRSGGDGVVVGPGSGSEPPVRALLEQLVELWKEDCCSSTPLHLLFTPLTVTAVLKANDTEVRLPLLLTLMPICLWVIPFKRLTSYCVWIAHYRLVDCRFRLFSPEFMHFLLCFMLNYGYVKCFLTSNGHRQELYSHLVCWDELLSFFFFFLPADILHSLKFVFLFLLLLFFQLCLAWILPKQIFDWISLKVDWLCSI